MPSTSMQVPSGLYIASAIAQRSQWLLKQLSKLESMVLKNELSEVKIVAPIYLAGVARAGSTILLEMLNQHPNVTSHRYSDFPNIYTPYWRNWLLQRSRPSKKTKQERTHQDRIQISEDSPEAIEEVLWMAFFDHRHDNDISQVLNSIDENPIFESFYCDHLRKLLLVRQCQRYIAKGNYNFTRLAYIQKLFPDARFVLPVRHPIQHLSSLIKQDRLFNQGLIDNPRGTRYLSWVGHHEFGPQKKLINIGDQAIIDEIADCWQRGDSVRAWALHWNSLYQFVLDQQAALPDLRESCLWVRYEELCNNSVSIIDQIVSHCQLDSAEFAEVKSFFAHHLTEPGYYSVEFSPTERQLIEQICGETATRLGYVL